uniref:NF-kappa-B inhibitor-like protein 1 n=1 Tax=Lepisosteus oculatus TaxID=7918 RepID=W5MFI2_LEPOC|nr:PREDICTED: NF-kappa-B inhibitor-like protein 1 [Lepisosteus oculatus]
MASRRQKRLLRYVEEGSLLKLKSYLRKHPDTDLSFSQGSKGRTPLHLACSLGDDAVLRLLLKKGADPLLQDRKGDTPLHLAARRVLKRGKRVYDDLVAPLRKHCPAAMEMPNNVGVTPQDILQWMKVGQGRVPPACRNFPETPDPEREWREKIFGECQDEFYETFGQYDDDFSREDAEEEDFGDWADQVRREYYQKQRQAQQAAAASAARSRGKRPETEAEAKSRRDFQARLEAEHAEYLARAARKEEEVRRGKKQRYEEKCAAAFRGESDSKLGYADIPWPAPQGSVQEMVSVMLHGADRGDRGAFRKLLRRQQALWHPDKFAQRCGGRLRELESRRILDTVTALSQELNKLAESIK